MMRVTGTAMHDALDSPSLLNCLFYQELPLVNDINKDAKPKKERSTKLMLRSQAIINQAHKAKPVVEHKPSRKAGPRQCSLYFHFCLSNIYMRNSKS